MSSLPTDGNTLFGYTRRPSNEVYPQLSLTSTQQLEMPTAIVIYVIMEDGYSDLVQAYCTMLDEQPIPTVIKQRLHLQVMDDLCNGHLLHTVLCLILHFVNILCMCKIYYSGISVSTKCMCVSVCDITLQPVPRCCLMKDSQWNNSAWMKSLAFATFNQCRLPTESSSHASSSSRITSVSSQRDVDKTEEVHIYLYILTVLIDFFVSPLLACQACSLL